MRNWFYIYLISTLFLPPVYLNIDDALSKINYLISYMEIISGKDYLRHNLKIICGAGSFAVLGSFADP